MFLGIVLAIFLTISYIHVTAQGADYVGFLFVLDHAFNISMVLSLLILCSAVGLWTLRRPRPSARTKFTRLGWGSELVLGLAQNHKI